MGHQIKSDLGSSSLASHMVICFCINEKLIIPARRRLKCYTARSGDKYQFCSTKEGLQTCFTKFEMGEARCGAGVRVRVEMQARWWVGAAPPSDRSTTWSARTTTAARAGRSSTATAASPSVTPPPSRPGRPGSHQQQ